MINSYDMHSKKLKIKDKAADKLKKLKKKRIIIRNLSFEVSEKELMQIFSKYGKVLEVKIPQTPDGKKRGFAFVQFENTKSLLKSMKDLNYKPIHGRPIAIDYAINKTEYQLKVQSVKLEKDPSHSVQTEVTEIKSEPEEEEEDDNDDDDDNKDSMPPETEDSINEEKATKFLREFGIKEETERLSDDSEDSDDESEVSASETKPNKPIAPENQKECAKKISSDVSEGKTVFMRNLAFHTKEEDLKELMQKYGACEYCLLCIDKLTDHAKGTAFVKFKEKDSAQKLITDSEKDDGIFLHGRKLVCNYAMSREDITKKNSAPTKLKDKRNLHLRNCGVIVPGSKEAEGVSQSDMAKRFQVETLKKQKLKNILFFVSDKRLVIHNLPENLTDVEFCKLCKTAAGAGAIVTEARVMRNFKKFDSRGVPISKGFGFVGFETHHHAMTALQHLNNNPHIFTPHQRPIVGFSIESKTALLTKERRKEKSQMMNKKRAETKNEDKSKTVDSAEAEKSSNSSISFSSKGKKGKKRKITGKVFTGKQNNKIQKLQSHRLVGKQESSPQMERKKLQSHKPAGKQKLTSQMKKKKMQSQEPVGKQKSTSRLKKKTMKLQQKRSRKGLMNKEMRNNISTLANKYKKQLMKKMA